MKVVFFTIGLLVLIIALSGCMQEVPNTSNQQSVWGLEPKNEGFLVYADQRIKFEYPSDWSMVEEPLLTMSGCTVAVVNKLNGDNACFIIQTGSPTTLEDHSNVYVEFLPSKFPGAELINLTDITISGLPGKRIEFIAPLQNGQSMHFVDYFTIKNNTSAYSSTAAISIDSGQESLSQIEKILQSFEIN